MAGARRGTAAPAAVLPIAAGPGVTDAALAEARATRILNAMADTLAVPSPEEEATVHAEYDEGVVAKRQWTWHVSQWQPLEISPQHGETCVVRCPFWVRAVFKMETNKGGACGESTFTHVRGVPLLCLCGTPAVDVRGSARY